MHIEPSDWKIRAVARILMAVGIPITLAAVACTAYESADAAADAQSDAIVQADKGPVRGTIADDHRTFQEIPPTGILA